MLQTELKATEQAKELLKEETAALIYFYSDSCAPCVSLRPKVIELLEKSFPKMKLVFVNSATHPLVAAHFNVFSNPTLLIFFEGKEYKRLSKYVSISQLEETIGRPYKMVF
ncbi:MAG TPA: thioredoxin family protein [Bacteroidales bacterium]